MASSNGTRWRLACDACEAGAWVGPAASGYDAWCEACQTAHTLAQEPANGVRCPRCSAPLAAWPRFVELWGELQHLDAVLAAWAGDPVPLATLLPERPRYLTDLTPPETAAGDPPALAALLAAVRHGDYRGALAGAPSAGEPRALAALAIALERTGDAHAALTRWDQVIATSDDARARLARGALLAKRGQLAAAASDFAAAGSTHEARWNRAALALQQAVGSGEALPEPAVLVRARAEAGAASAYWSDPSVGRLLWTLLVERALARGSDPAAGPSEATLRSLRAAEAEFEHDTFWDRAMQLVAWVRLGAHTDAARIAGPLARAQAATLLDEPALQGAALLSVTTALAAARSAMDLADPVEARHAIAEAFAREDLRRFRIPCANCGRGSVGLEETADSDEV